MIADPEQKEGGEGLVQIFDAKNTTAPLNSSLAGSSWNFFWFSINTWSFVDPIARPLHQKWLTMACCSTLSLAMRP